MLNQSPTTKILKINGKTSDSFFPLTEFPRTFLGYAMEDLEPNLPALASLMILRECSISGRNPPPLVLEVRRCHPVARDRAPSVAMSGHQVDANEERKGEFVSTRPQFSQLQPGVDEGRDASSIAASSTQRAPRHLELSAGVHREHLSDQPEYPARGD